MCRLFLLTVDEVRTTLRGRVLVEFHVMTTGASVKPADIVRQETENYTVYKHHLAIKTSKVDRKE